tara:strand:+ start:176 stop:979 length:804 start_codon:yes stop_codon:yes gene_type:complete
MISYIGGKSRMAKWIGSYIPENKTYVEVFGGAFWVYINGEISSKRIIYNDKNRFMANLFECMRTPTEFLESLILMESQNKEQFDLCQKQLNTIVDSNINYFLGDKGIGSQYAYCATQVFSGSKILESKFIDLRGKYGSKYNSLQNKLKKESIIKKLKNISEVENLDYTDLILKYDSPDTFFYVDPPYWKTENYYSNHDFDSEDHNKLIEILKNTKGKWALSYYDFPQLSEWLPKDKFNWIEREFNKAAGAQKGKKQNKGTELLIMNY